MIVTRSAGTTGTVGCTITTTPITAQASDYDVTGELLVFMEGQQNATEFMITINNDAIPELEEVRTFMLLQK